jgi:hypothetical protein
MAGKPKKVPKRIAGVKLPKALRRGLRDLASTENGRTVLLEALTAAGAALVASQAQPTPKAGKAAAKQAADASAAAGDSRQQALEDAARSFTEALRRSTPAETPPPQTSGPAPSAATH